MIFFDAIIPNREIYVSKYGGQNMQMLWPYLYHTKCIATQEPLYSYLIRKNSVSRNFFKTMEQKRMRLEDIFNTAQAVLDGIKDLPQEQKNRIVDYWRKKTDYEIYITGVKCSNKPIIREYYHKLSMQGKSHLFTALYYYASFIPCGIRMVRFGVEVKNKVKNVIHQ